METGKLKLALSAGALALSMALAGCGGGGSSGNVNGNGDVSMELTTAVSNATEAVEAINLNKGATPTAALIKTAEDAIKAVTDLDEDYDTEAWDGVIGAAKRHVSQPGCGDGTKLDTVTNDCLPDTDMADADKVREAAETLFGKIDTSNVASVPGTNPNSFAQVKDEYKGSKSFYAKGLTFAVANADGSTASTARPSDGTNPGYHIITEDNNPLEVTSSKFTRDTTPVIFDASSGAFSGEYQGIPGMFLCIGTADATCTSAPAPEGKFTLAGGSDTAGIWHFKPNSETATTSKGAKLAEWGWWIENQGEEDEVVRLFYDKTTDSDAPDPVTTPLTIAAGTATYKGDALGQYAVVRSGTGSASGEFEAKVTLTADFEEDELSGEIHDFNVGTEWKVMLEKQEIGAGGTAAIEGETKWMMGTDEGLRSGEWAAQMHGSDSATDTPSHILGGFSAVHSNASMIGAFGTELEKPGN